MTGSRLSVPAHTDRLPGLGDTRQALHVHIGHRARTSFTVAPSMRRARLCTPPFGSITTKSRRSPRASFQPDCSSAASKLLPRLSVARQSAVMCCARFLGLDARALGLLHFGMGSASRSGRGLPSRSICAPCTRSCPNSRSSSRATISCLRKLWSGADRRHRLGIDRASQTTWQCSRSFFS